MATLFERLQADVSHIWILDIEDWAGDGHILKAFTDQELMDAYILKYAQENWGTHWNDAPPQDEEELVEQFYHMGEVAMRAEYVSINNSLL